MKLYLAGPMGGIPDNNYPLFERACNILRRMGHEVFSPHELNEKLNLTVGDPAADRKAFAHELTWVAEHAEGLVMLPGWEHSGGAFAEWSLARRLKHKFFYAFVDENGMLWVPTSLKVAE